MRLRWTLLLLIACVTCAPDARAEDEQKRVLGVYSTRRDTQLPTIGDREMPGLLAQGLAIKPDYYSEYVDAARFPEKQYREAFADYLRLKYAGARFDAVIAMHRTAYDMVTAVRADIFPK